MPWPGRFFISERIWLNSRSRGSRVEAMGIAKAACSQGSMIDNGKAGKYRNPDWKNSGADDENAGDTIEKHDYLW
jgi:hypothetical protein